MNCRTFRRRSMESWPGDRDAPAPELEAHRRGCRRCAAAWSADRELVRQCVLLRRETVQVEVRGRVLERLRDRTAPVAAVRPVRNAVGVAATLGAAIAIGWLIVSTFPAPELGAAWRLVIEKAPEWIAWGLQRVVQTALSLAALFGAALLQGALMVVRLHRWMLQLENALPSLILFNGLMALLLAAGVTTLLRRQPAPRRFL